MRTQIGRKTESKSRWRTKPNKQKSEWENRQYYSFKERFLKTKLPQYDVIYKSHFLPILKFCDNIYFSIWAEFLSMLLFWEFASLSVVCSMTSRKVEKGFSKYLTAILLLSSPLHPKLSTAALSNAPFPCFGVHKTHVKSCRITLAGLNGTSTFLCCITFQLRIFSTSPFFTRNSSQLRIAASRRTRMENGRRAAWIRGKKQIQFLP